MDFEVIVAQLESTGLCVVPGFLSREELLSLRGDLDTLWRAGGFARAGTGKGEGNDVRDLVRRDQTFWLERACANPVQEMLWDKLDSIQRTLNRSLYMGLVEFEGHYAVYPQGGFYKRHLDCFHQDDSRMVSLILYLNEDWNPSDGGQLRIYQGQSHTDVEPRSGTLVLFLSRDTEHEVLPSHAPRLSFTGWFKQKT
jgi:SM-20-related protein